MSAVSSSALNLQGQGTRQSTRQTRTNPSRTSKTIGRSSFGFGRGSTAEVAAAPPVPHGFYPAITHFTDAITALPREFRRHNSLLKEVDAKAWALEENLLQLLQSSLESQPVSHPPHPAPIVGGVIRDDVLPKVGDIHRISCPSNYLCSNRFPLIQELTQAPETSESKNRRLLFDRVRQNLSDLMMTADEKNHVISNANEELDRQMVRLDTIFPYIAGEISDEARLGSLTHWAYSNKSTAKAATNERPRREAVNHRQDLAHALQEAEAASRSEARREAVLARKRRRANADGDYEDTRTARKTNTGKSRGDTADQSAAANRRKVERSAADMSTPMERSASGATSQRMPKEGAEKKRSRATNPNAAAARKKFVYTLHSMRQGLAADPFFRTNAASNAASPVLAPSPLIGTFNAPRAAASPGPNTSRPQSSRTQLNAGPANNSRQRPSSSASSRVNQPNSCMCAHLYNVACILTHLFTSKTVRPPICTPRRPSQKRNQRGCTRIRRDRATSFYNSWGQARGHGRPCSRLSRGRDKQRPELEELDSRALNIRRKHPVPFAANTEHRPCAPAQHQEERRPGPCHPLRRRISS